MGIFVLNAAETIVRNLFCIPIKIDFINLPLDMYIVHLVCIVLLYTFYKHHIVRTHIFAILVS